MQLEESLEDNSPISAALVSTAIEKLATHIKKEHDLDKTLKYLREAEKHAPSELSWRIQYLIAQYEEESPIDERLDSNAPHRPYTGEFRADHKKS